MAEDKHLPFAELELLAPLSLEEVHNLARRLPEMELQGDQLLYTPLNRSESFFLLLKGRMRIYRMRGSREITLSVRHPGEFFGEAALAGLAKGDYAQALEPATVAIMNRHVLQRLLQDRSQVGLMMMHILLERLDVYEDMIQEISLMETTARLAGLLVRMVQEEGIVASKDSAGEDYAIPTRYTHQLLASMIGCERPALTRALGELREAGAVRLSGRYIHVIDLDALKG